jgi:hypothetical protein
MGPDPMRSLLRTAAIHFFPNAGEVIKLPEKMQCNVRKSDTIPSLIEEYSIFNDMHQFINLRKILQPSSIYDTAQLLTYNMVDTYEMLGRLRLSHIRFVIVIKLTMESVILKTLHRLAVLPLSGPTKMPTR